MTATPAAHADRLPVSAPTAALALALLLGLQPISTDLYLPALPALAQALHAPMRTTQLTMSALLLAFGIAQLVWGPVADRFGRRPVLLASGALLVVASVGAALAPGIEWLVGWRAAQGACVAAAVVCARAMVRDLYEPQRGAMVMSQGLSGLGIIAICSPLLGGVLGTVAGWRAPLAAVAVLALAVLLFVAVKLPETLSRPNPSGLAFGPLARQALQIVRHPTFQAWSALTAASYGGLFTLLAASSFAYIGVLEFSPVQYGLTMSGGSLAYLAGTVVCRRWLKLHGLPGAVRRGAFFTLAGGLGMALGVAAGGMPAAAVVAGHWLFCLGHGVHQPCGQAGAVGPFRHAAGVAAALAGCLLALVAFGIGVWLGSAIDGSLRPMAYGLGFWAVATSLIAWTLVQRHGHPQATS